ncbi:MAG TPA: serine/threonine protein kinase, partial [Phormidium sp.]
LASGSKDGTFKLWSLQTLKIQKTITGYKSGIAGGDGRGAFNSDGKTIAAIGMVNDKSKIKLWSVQTGELLQILNSTTEAHAMWSLAFSPDGKILAGGTLDTFSVKLWSVETGQEIQTLTGHSKPVTAVAFSPNGQTLASIDIRTIKLWRIN